MENDEGAGSGRVVDPADVSRLPWWRRPPLPAIVAVVLVVAFVIWMSRDNAFEASDLELLPAKSSFVVVINVDAVISSGLGEVIDEAFREQIRSAEGEMREEVAFTAHDLSHFVIGGNVEAGEPVFMFAFLEEPEDAAIAKLAESLRVSDKESHEVNGYRVWGGESDRMAMLEIRAGTFLVGRRTDVDHALSVLDSGGSNPVAELMDDHSLLDAPIAAVFDWRRIRGLDQSLGRDLRGAIPAMMQHLGPILARVRVDDGLFAEWMMIDSDDDVVMRSTTEIDGDFLEDIVWDLARWAGRRLPDRPKPDGAHPSGR